MAQKERLKQLKKNVHVLAMSATPVPRTLQLSLAGVRDLSVIETPPKDRMAVETAILPYNERAGARGDRVRARARRPGLLRLQPGRVDRADVVDRCASWFPACASPSATGRWTSASSSRRMHAFTARRVRRAARHHHHRERHRHPQRQHHDRAPRRPLRPGAALPAPRPRRAQQPARLLLPAGARGPRALRAGAQKRLAAIREFTELGAGFRIAARDLEIRGAGNLLGAEQSGHIAAVGIETYLQAARGDRARAARARSRWRRRRRSTIDLPVRCRSPTDYVQDAEPAHGDLPQARLGRRAVGRACSPSSTTASGRRPRASGRLAGLADLKRLAERCACSRSSAVAASW